MKKTILILSAIALTFASCNKENNCTSSCGTILTYGYDGGGMGYYFSMQNDCTGNSEMIPVDEQTYNDNQNNTNYCIPNG